MCFEAQKRLRNLPLPKSVLDPAPRYVPVTPTHPNASVINGNSLRPSVYVTHDVSRVRYMN